MHERDPGTPTGSGWLRGSETPLPVMPRGQFADHRERDLPPFGALVGEAGMGVKGVRVVHHGLEGVIGSTEHEMDHLSRTGEPAGMDGQFVDDSEHRIDQRILDTVHVKDDLHRLLSDHRSSDGRGERQSVDEVGGGRLREVRWGRRTLGDPRSGLERER
ncbi:hypothetical protein [Streptomyces sp. NPDC058812]|uniref:hypothetical protein n=1 Tax=unclassified Streptomyces TaxID=2593676 RepID=UPI0036B0830A